MVTWGALDDLSQNDPIVKICSFGMEWPTCQSLKKHLQFNKKII